MLANGDLRTVLSSRGFRRLLWVRLTSQGADGLFQAGLAGSVLFNPDRHATGLAVAFGFAVLLLPYSVVGPYVGVFLDRWSRRTVLYRGNLLRAGLVIPTAALIWAGDAFLFGLFALLVIGVNRFILSGLSAALPHVIAKPNLVTGNAVSTTFGSICFALGLGAAAVLQNQVGASDASYAGIALIGSVGYVAAALIARSSFSVTDLGPDRAYQRHGVVAELIDVARGMIAGVRHLARRGGAAYPLLAQSAHRTFYGVLTITALLLYRNYFTTDGDYTSSIAGLGQVVVAGAVGGLLAAAVTPWTTRRLGGRIWVSVLLGAIAVVLLALGLPYDPLLLVLTVFAINFASQSTKIVVDTAIQQECADHYRGWVFSVNDMSFNVCFVIGLFAGALLLPENGYAPPVLVAVAVGYGLLALWFWWVTGRWVRRSGHDIAVMTSTAAPVTATTD